MISLRLIGAIGIFVSILTIILNLPIYVNDEMRLILTAFVLIIGLTLYK